MESSSSFTLASTISTSQASPSVGDTPMPPSEIVVKLETAANEGHIFTLTTTTKVTMDVAMNATINVNPHNPSTEPLILTDKDIISEEAFKAAVSIAGANGAPIQFNRIQYDKASPTMLEMTKLINFLIKHEVHAEQLCFGMGDDTLPFDEANSPFPYASIVADEIIFVNDCHTASGFSAAIFLIKLGENFAKECDGNENESNVQAIS